MTRSLLKYVAGLLLLAVGITRAASPGTAFTYQGRLNDVGSPANGSYDLRFTLFNADSGGSQAGPSLTNNAVDIVGGLFAATLDFGGVFDGNAYWLEISVRTNGGGAFVLLSPRQPLTPTPYALFAPSAGSAASAASAVTASSVAPGAVNSAGLADGAVTGSKIADGEITPADLNPGSFNTTFWQVSGNAGTTPDLSFLGTTDNLPLDLRVNNERGFRLMATRSNDTVNVLGGSPLNYIDPGLISATIGGGGTPEFGGASRTNSVGSDFATIGGGAGNRIGTNANSGIISGGYGHTINDNTFDGTISGGSFHTIGTNASYSTIGGGQGNWIQDNAGVATINGGLQNVIRTNTGYATIGGGAYNGIGTNSNSGVISGGYAQSIGDNTFDGTIGGGSFNSIGTNSWYSTVGGGHLNNIYANAGSSTIAGGLQNVVEDGAGYATIAGGLQNGVRSNALQSTIAGGYGNTISNSQATIGGGYQNSNVGWAATIAGGWMNLATGTSDFIGGGTSNAVTNDYGVVGGGYWNTNGGYAGVIAGGANNQGAGAFASIGGGLGNKAGGIGSWATVSGGTANEASGAAAAIPGGQNNLARGNTSFAAGTQAKAIHDGAFVWADLNFIDFSSTASNQFSVRANGGVRLETGGAGLTVDGAPALVGSVSTSQLTDGSVTTAKLADGSVATATLADGAVTSSKMANNSVGSAQLADSIALGDAASASGVLSLYRTAAGTAGITLDGNSGTITTYGSDGLEQIRLWDGSWGEIMLFDNTGNDNTVLLSATSNSGGQLFLRSPDGTNRLYLYGDFSGTARIGIGRSPDVNQLEVAGNASKDVAGSWLANSDKRIKKDIRPLTNALDVINRVRPVGFHYDEAYRTEHPGIPAVEYYNVLAQEFAEVFPNSVQKGGDKLANGEQILQVDTYPATIYSIAAIQELDQKLREKDTRVSELEKRNASLENRLAALEKLLAVSAARH